MTKTVSTTRPRGRTSKVWRSILAVAVGTGTAAALLTGPAFASAPQSEPSGESESAESSGAANVEPRGESEAEGTLAPDSAHDNTGAVYENPGHADAEVFTDHYSGKEVVLRSGITRHETRPPVAVPQGRAFSPLSTIVYSEVFPSVTLLDFPSGGTVEATAPLQTTVLIDIPDSAQPGDVYTLVAPIPFGFDTSSLDREIKDASGTVFAITKAGEGTGGVPSSGVRTLRFVLTDAVADHAAIEGFIELRYRTATKSAVETYVFNIEGADGTKLGPNEPVKTAASNPQSNTFVPGSGTTFKNEPTVSPAVKVKNAQMKDGFFARFSSGSAGLTIQSCENATVAVEGFRADGFYEIRLIGQVETLTDVECTVSSDKQTITITFQKAAVLPAGFTDAVFRIQSGSFVGQGPNMSYPFSMRTNWTNTSPPRSQTWSGTVTTGTPTGSGASFLSLSTDKQAEFTTQHGNAKPTLGDTITYKITTRPGPDNARSVENLVTTDVLPQGLEFVSATNGGTYNPDTREVIWGPRILTSTGQFTDVVKTRITGIPTDGSLRNVAQNVGDGVCQADDSISICEASTTTEAGQLGFDFTKYSSVVPAEADRGFDGAIAGDKITYWFIAKNTGEVALTTLKLNDELLGLAGAECFPSGTVLAPGESVECADRYEYTITAADQQKGSVVNQAVGTVPGLPPKQSETTNPTADPSFEFEKHIVAIKDARGSTVTGGTALEGYQIHFGFTIENTGDVALKILKITDPLLGVSGAPCLPEGTVIDPGESVQCQDSESFQYTVTSADALAGNVHNIATATVPGLPNQEDETDVPVLPTPVIPELPNTGAGGMALPLATGVALLLGSASAWVIRNQRHRNTANRVD